MYAGPLARHCLKPRLPEMGVANRLDELEWDFIRARAESPDLDSLGWTDREFSCLDAILEHKRERHQGERYRRD
jgi:hypothetical protein